MADAYWVCNLDLEHNCGGKPPGEEPTGWFDGMECGLDDCHGTMKWMTGAEVDARWEAEQAARVPALVVTIIDPRVTRPIESAMRELPQRVLLNGERIPWRIEADAMSDCRLFFGEGVSVNVGDKVEIYYPE